MERTAGRSLRWYGTVAGNPVAQGLLHPELLVTSQRPLWDIAGAFADMEREDTDEIKIDLNVKDA